MKTTKDILEQQFISTADLMTLTGFGRDKCRSILNELKELMIDKNMYIAYPSKLMIPTKLVRKKLGL